MDKQSLNKDSTNEELLEVLNSEVGTVVFITETDFYEVIGRLFRLKPQESDFDLSAIMAGTDLYSMYGSGHLIITQNTINQ